MILQTYTTISKYLHAGYSRLYTLLYRLQYIHYYTGAVDIRNQTHKHPLKDVIHYGSHMHTATKARWLCAYVSRNVLHGSNGKVLLKGQYRPTNRYEKCNNKPNIINKYLSVKVVRQIKWHSCQWDAVSLYLHLTRTK